MANSCLLCILLIPVLVASEFIKISDCSSECFDPAVNSFAESEELFICHNSRSFSYCCSDSSAFECYENNELNLSCSNYDLSKNITKFAYCPNLSCGGAGHTVS